MKKKLTKKELAGIKTRLAGFYEEFRYLLKHTEDVCFEEYDNEKHTTIHFPRFTTNVPKDFYVLKAIPSQFLHEEERRVITKLWQEKVNAYNDFSKYCDENGGGIGIF